MIEFTHRIAAGVVAVLIALMAWRAMPPAARLTAARAADRSRAGVLVLAQAALGGLTVEKGLEDELVAAHLGLAMLLLGLLFVLRRAAESDAGPGPESVRGLRPLTAVAAGLVLATIVAGGYVAGTEGHGTPNQPLVGAHEACGTGWNTAQFPGCNGRAALLRPVAARRHPAHPPPVHVPGRDRRARHGRRRAAPPGARAEPSGSRSPLLVAQIALGVDQRLGRQARRA